MKILDVEIDFSLSDIDNIEKIKKGYENVLDKEAIVAESKADFLTAMKKECEIAKTFFDEVFGIGTAEKLFGNKNDYEVIMDALAEVVDKYVENHQRLQNKFSKYSSNRAQRRSK